ncbi:MAG: hypothetical protein KAS39_04465 [Actinomycetia bacterium]|nr:hypothetical protein [Actinomycetes bacterium]
MKDLLEKGIAATLGFWLLLHEKADDIIKEMIEQGKIAPEEGRKFIEELSIRVEKEKEGLKEKVTDFSHTRIRELGFVSRSDFEKLADRVNVLEKKKKTAKKKSPKVDRKRQATKKGRKPSS